MIDFGELTYLDDLEEVDEGRGRKGYPTPAQDEIFRLLKRNPLTIEEVAETLGKPVRITSGLIRKLERRGPVNTLYVSLGKCTLKHKHYSSDILGKLNRKKIAYVIGDETLVGKRIAQNLPTNLDWGTKNSITKRLIPTLPKRVDQVVIDYMKKH
ncbi:MAG: hypothetical protein ABIE55_03535 [Candidatus Aenigmatarchaeota archaeon]